MKQTPVQSGKSILRPRARLIKTIGEELISSDIVALLELVKNSYDADASIITIKFSGAVYVPTKDEKKDVTRLVRTGSSIEIYDDGIGMALDTVKAAWMEPATISKKNSQESKGRKRKLTGEKGIGRFSSAKLSKSLEMITRVKGDNEVLATFDWKDFENASLFLDEVNVNWEVREPLEFVENRHGTKLYLKDLNADWNEEKFRQLRITLQRLVNPVVPVTDFLIELDLPEEFESYSGVIEAPTSLSRPNYGIKGSVDAKGVLSYEYSSKKDPKPVAHKGPIVKPGEDFLTGPFSFDFRVWDRDPQSLQDVAKETDSRVAEIRTALNEISGISIYRDGFRVLPYGDPGIDWLRLDLRRVNNPTLRISNNQIIGFIAIELKANPKFTDQSNREGIVDSDEFSQLKEFAVKILSELEVKRYEERPREDPGGKKEKGLFDAFTIAPVVDLVNRKFPNDAEARRVVAATEASLQAGVERVQEVLSRYRRLSTLGLLVDAVLHDGNNFLGLVGINMQMLNESIKKDGFDNATFKKHTTAIMESRKILAQLFKRLEPFGGRRRHKAASILLETVIQNSFALFHIDIEKMAIAVDLPETETTVLMVESDLQLVVVNLLQNAIFWLGERAENRRILVEVGHDQEQAWMIFSDNGPGIDEAHIEAIFEPYFSTRPNGIGLGLTIVGEIATESGGGLVLIENGPLDGASFKVSFPISHK